MRPRVFFETQKIAVHLFTDVRVEFAEVSLRGGSDLNPVRQDSVSQFSYQVAERNRAFLFRFLQGGAGVCYVGSVYFFLGKALQEMKVFHRDQSGHVFSPAGHYCSLFTVGRTVHDIRKFFARFRNVQACHILY